MKSFFLIPLLFLSACSSPKLVLRSQPPQAVTESTAVRHPEIIRAYHFGRYTDPNDDLVMHEQHVVYRVEESSRWDFRPGDSCGNTLTSSAVPVDAAFAPAPVNDAILAEVNSQRLATAQIIAQARTLASALTQFQSALEQARTNLQQMSALREMVTGMKQRLDLLEAAQTRTSSISTTNEPSGLLHP